MKKNTKPKTKESLPLPVPDFQALFETVPGLYLILTLDLVIVAVSDAYLAATMTKRKEIIGRNIFDVFPDNPNDPEAKATFSLNASFEAVLTTKAPHAMATQKYDIRRPESEGGGFEERYWNPINSPCFDKNGNMTNIIHCVEDVTQVVKLNRQREQQLKENEALRLHNKHKEAEAFARVQESDRKLKSLVSTILDTIIDGVITINHKGEIQSFNKACNQLFGYTNQEVLGKNVNILMPEPYRSEHDNYLNNYRSTGTQKIIGTGREVSGRRKDGSVFPMELAVGETKQGGDHAFVGIIRDVSDRKEAEKIHEQFLQAQKMESLGQLTGGIAHDFNNLLAIILGNLDFMVERTKEDDSLRTFIMPSIKAAEHGAELTKQLLAFSRKQALQPKVISMNQLLNYFITLVRHTLGERIEVILALDDRLWNVDVDPSQVQNALLNLAVNARDAMPRGGKLIFETQNIILDKEYAEYNQDVIPGEHVMIAVSDTGEGMSQEVLEKAFEPFFTTKEVGKGSGLGLSMVYGFVKQSKGHIKIYSELGHGTSIKIYLPRSEQGVIRSEDDKIKLAAIEKKAKRVLVVEDNRSVLKLTSAMVESLGYIVLQAEEADTALDVLKSRSDIDLLLTDVMLPGAINGPTLAKQALALHPHLKILFNSGYAEQAILQSGILEEGVNLISKPFRKQQLADKIQEVLK